MRLKSEELEELNTLLQDKSLDIPEYRRTVTLSGKNYSWLQKNITTKNSNLSERLKTLLNIDQKNK